MIDLLYLLGYLVVGAILAKLFEYFWGDNSDNIHLGTIIIFIFWPLALIVITITGIFLLVSEIMDFILPKKDEKN